MLALFYEVTDDPPTTYTAQLSLGYGVMTSTSTVVRAVYWALINSSAYDMYFETGALHPFVHNGVAVEGHGGRCPEANCTINVPAGNYSFALIVPASTSIWQTTRCDTILP